MAKNTTKKNGVMIAFRDTLTFSLLQEHIDPQGRFLIVVAELDHITYTIVNLYAPNVRSLRFIRKVVSMAKKVQKGNLIICGDFNSIMNTELDVSSMASKQRPSLDSLCHEERLYDPWRCLRTTERDYTFYSAVHKSYSRIDFFLTDLYTLQNVQKADIHNITWSDHAPVTIEIVDANKHSHKPLWRNNTFLLSHPKIRDEIAAKITEFFQFNNNADCSPMTIWCAHKAFARGALIQVASREKKKKQQRMTNLLEKIADLEAQHKNPATSSSEILKSLNNCREEVRQEIRADYDTFFKKLKVSYYSQNNRAGKILASQLKKKTGTF